MYKTILSVLLLIVVVVVFYLAVKPQKNSESSSATSHPEDFLDWSTFVPASGIFQVSLPTAPQYFDDTIELPFTPGKGGYEIYASTKVNGTLFMVSAVLYPKAADTSNPQETLKALIEQLSYTRPGNRIIKLEDTEFKSYPALDFLVENQDFRMEGKASLVDKRVYILTYIARKEDFNSHEYEHFLSSFSFLKTEPKTDTKI